MGIVDDLHPSRLRYLFYAVSPNETTFASIDDVPDYTKMTTAWMTILMLTEMLLLDKSKYALNDTITSATSGILYLLFKVGGKYLSAAVYASVYEKVHLVALDTTSPLTWLLCFFTEDLAYYLAHRCMHECGIFWAFHQMHHSSEYYNLSTALRKGVFLEVGAATFELLQAVIIPPQIFLPHKFFNLLYQFWLHTELVPKLGPLEYVLNTPSAHRVHHGRNPYCIDRNYAGTLIIWDRLFGTYAEEREDEQISYGLVDNVKSFNPFWLQWFDLAFFLYGKGLQKDGSGRSYFPSIKDKITAIFAPPGYYPGVKTRRFFWWWCLEDNTYGIPEVDLSVPKYNPPLSNNKKAYLISQLLFLITYTHLFYERRMEMDWLEFCAQLAVICSTIQIFGLYFDNDDSAPFHDQMRCYGLIAYCVRYPSISILVFTFFSVPAIFYFDSELKEKVANEEEERKRREKEQRKLLKKNGNKKDE